MNTKRVKEILLSAVSFCSSFSANGAVPSEYDLAISTVDDRQGHLIITYTNKSETAHCLRAQDFRSELYGDSLYVNTVDGSAVTYIGPIPQVGGDRTPSEFIVVPPGERIMYSLFLWEFYKLPKRTSVVVAYSVPVIPCKVILDGYINIPPTDFLKDKVRDPTAEKTDLFESDYPEWTQHGFIAVSVPKNLP